MRRAKCRTCGRPGGGQVAGSGERVAGWWWLRGWFATPSLRGLWLRRRWLRRNALEPGRVTQTLRSRCFLGFHPRLRRPCPSDTSCFARCGRQITPYVVSLCNPSSRCRSDADPDVALASLADVGLWTGDAFGVRNGVRRSGLESGWLVLMLRCSPLPGGQWHQISGAEAPFSSTRSDPARMPDADCRIPSHADPVYCPCDMRSPAHVWRVGGKSEHDRRTMVGNAHPPVWPRARASATESKPPGGLWIVG